MTRTRIKEYISALLLTAAILLSTVFLAGRLSETSLYRQSRVVSMLVQQDSVGIENLLKDTRNIDMVVKFAGALTSAYINFELIPINEASTFVTVFESLPEHVIVDSFEYRRKDLYIKGKAQSQKDYEEFIANLEEKGNFSTISGHMYESTDGSIHFEISCLSDVIQTYLNF